MTDKLYTNATDFSPQQLSVLGNLTRAFNRYTGIINAVAEREDLQGFGLSWFQCLSANAAIIFNIPKEISSGGLGIDKKPNIAILKCFGEALERYALSDHHNSRIIKGKLSTLGNYEKELLSYSPSFMKAAKANEYNFIPVKSLRRPKAKVVWPADKVYVGFPKPKLSAYSTSTGVAFHSDINKCILSAMLEIIERDSIILNHYLKPKFTYIEPHSVPSKLVSTVLDKGFKVRIIQLYNRLGVPVILSFISEGTSAATTFGIGCSAELHINDAIDKSIREALFTFTYSKYLLHLRQIKVPLIDKLYEHFLYYQHENFSTLTAHYARARVVEYDKLALVSPLTQPELQLKMIQEYADVLYVNIAPADITSLGYCVARVIAPLALDIHTKESYLLKDHPRFASTRDYLTRIGAKPLKSSLARAPHPMP